MHISVCEVLGNSVAKKAEEAVFPVLRSIIVAAQSGEEAGKPAGPPSPAPAGADTPGPAAPATEKAPTAEARIPTHVPAGQ